MWKVNEVRGEGFSGWFSYFGKLMQQGATDWRKKHLTNTVTEHRVQTTDLTHGPSDWVDEGGSFCKIRTALHSTCPASKKRRVVL
jgi:hypothetical protein